MDNQYLFSAKEAPYSITFKLLHHTINPISYFVEMRSNPNGCYWGYPNNFSFYGSINGNDWTQLHNEVSGKLNTRAVLLEIPIDKTNKYFRFFKFIAHSIDRVSPEIYSSISRIEINGKFYNKEKCTVFYKSCTFKYTFVSIFIFFLS